MFAGWLIGTAWGAPVVCDADDAWRIVTEARIDPGRAPVSHPELVPGLALRAADTDEALKSAISEVCAPGGTLSLSPAESWDAADWSARTWILTRSEPDGCALAERSIALTVGIRGGEAVYRLRGRLPDSRTPVGDCAEVAQFRDERTVDGDDGPVRLVVVLDQVGGDVVRQTLILREASASGWRERPLLDPAPERMLSGGDGPVVELTDRLDPKWAVAHADRRGAPPDCTSLAGQTVWTPPDWTPQTGDAALRLLAERGLWRFAGEDGWFLIVAQDDEEDAERLLQRADRLRARSGMELLVVPSAWFPGLNPGYLIAIPPPFASRADAEAARQRWSPRRQAYVKRAWAALDPCARP